MCRDTAVDVDVTDHILGFWPSEGHPTVMPLTPDHVRLSCNALAAAPCLRRFVVSKSMIKEFRSSNHYSHVSSQTQRATST
jgi:hypothetical protein